MMSFDETMPFAKYTVCIQILSRSEKKIFRKINIDLSWNTVHQKYMYIHMILNENLI